MRMKNEKLTYPLTVLEVKSMLQECDVTPTKQRVEIAGYLFQKNQHLSADKILEGVNLEGHKVSRATVYNTLGLFAQKGLIKEVLIDRERVFYDSNTTPHHHIFNVSNGELKDIEKTGVELVNQPILEEGLKVVATDVIIRVESESL